MLPKSVPNKVLCYLVGDPEQMLYKMEAKTEKMIN